MSCRDSNVMTAPVVMTLDDPVLHRLVNEAGSGKRQPNEPGWG
jgi:hypothetical protein